MTDPSLVAGTGLLARHGLTMDLCVRQHQLDEVVELVDLCPDVLFVLDHLGKPRVTAEDFAPWAESLTRLAGVPNVRCKLSGLLSEAPPGPTYYDRAAPVARSRAVRLRAEPVHVRQ